MSSIARGWPEATATDARLLRAARARLRPVERYGRCGGERNGVRTRLSRASQCGCSSVSARAAAPISRCASWEEARRIWANRSSWTTARARGGSSHSRSPRAMPDGHTLLVAADLTIQPNLALKLPYDPSAISRRSPRRRAPYILVVHPGVEAKTVKELIALAKAARASSTTPRAARHAQHLATELFAYMAGINIVHVPYRARNRARGDRRARQILTSGLPQGLPHVQAGRMRALGVTTRSARRGARRADDRGSRRARLRGHGLVRDPRRRRDAASRRGQS